MRSKYKHPRGHFAKRNGKYYGDSRRLTLAQIRAYHSKRKGR